MGLGGVNALGVPGEDTGNVEDAVDFIARVRQEPGESIPVGRNVVVIGGGMTAIDAAVQAKLLGRRDRHHRLPPRPRRNGGQPL